MTSSCHRCNQCHHKWCRLRNVWFGDIFVYVHTVINVISKIPSYVDFFFFILEHHTIRAELTEELVMEKEKGLLSLAFAQYRHALEYDFNATLTVQPKSAVASEKYRKKGNDLLLHQKKHDAEVHKAILTHYSKSVALAPVGSQELAFAYGNRSYFLLHIHKYNDCIEDIDHALKLTLSDGLKAKLLCRKAECLKKLGCSNISSILETVESLAEKINGQDRIKLLKMIGTVKALHVDTKEVGEKRKINNDLLLTDDYSSCVLIEYSEKYGRHLVAAKDDKSGDIIFVEEIYASVFQQEPSVLTCDYCMKPVWSSIPCDFCNWSMYCTEGCKQKAWDRYHDIECSLISHLKEYRNFNWKFSTLPIRILITGIKENGGIENLRKEIGLLNQSADGPTTELLKNSNFGINNFQNIYSLASFAPDNDLPTLSAFVILILIGLIKYTELKNDLNVEKIEDLLSNDNTKFLGSLLIKIMTVLNCNACGIVYNLFPDTRKESEIATYDGVRCMSVLFSLINNSCFATADWRCTEQNKLLVFALQPIKKNSQIFITYRYGFERYMQSMRQEELSKQYNFTCDCRPCVEKWPIISGVEEKWADDDLENFFINGSFSMESIEEVRKVLIQGRKFNKSHIKKVSSSIEQCRNWKQPSPMYSMLVDMLRGIFTAMYSPKSLLFDKCD